MGFIVMWRNWIQYLLLSSKTFFFKKKTIKSSFFRKIGETRRPLSLFLYIFVVEGLKIVLIKLVHKEIYHGIQFPNFGLNISFFQYVNDVFFIKKWPKENARNVIEVLLDYIFLKIFRLTLRNVRLCYRSF